MLYKRKDEPTLIDELFRDPPSEYRAAPFWAWNDTIDKDELQRQVKEFGKMGFGGFHMHVRSGMATPYLSCEYMELIKACVDEAKGENMLAYLYDEDRWPSGAAGGLVTRHKKYRQKTMVLVCDEDESLKPRGRWGLQPSYRIISKGAEDYATAYTSDSDSFSEKMPLYEACADQGRTYLLAAFDVKVDNDGYLESYKIIGRDDEAEGKKWLAYVYSYPESGWFNGETYIDALSKEAVGCFIDTVYKRFADTLADDLGGAVPAIFTDEPQHSFVENMKAATGVDAATMSWTTDMPKSFYEAYGIDIIPRIPEIFWERKGEPATLRYLIRNHVTDRFSAAFAEQIGEYCRRRGFHLTGHVQYEDTLLRQTKAVGEAMRSYGGFGIPGIDMLCDAHCVITAKQAQSAAHQYGKEGMMSELYGVTGWQFDFRGHKHQGDWQAAMGVTLRVPHLSWYSMKGSAKRDYPASIFYQSSWYREYKYIEDHFARLNTALTRGVPKVGVAVIHPIESYWLSYGAEDLTGERREQLENGFKNVTDWLLCGLIDFDYISEATLPKLHSEGDVAGLSVGKMSYSTVIIPDVDTLRSTTVDILERFIDRGGEVITLSDAPGFVDGRISSAARALYDRSKRIPFTRDALLGALEHAREVEIRHDGSGQPCRDLIYTKRADGESGWLFLAHLNKRWENPDRTEEPMHITVRLGERVRPTLYDTLTGSIVNIPFAINGDGTDIPLTVYPYDSVLLRLDPYRGEEIVSRVEKRPVDKTLDFKGKVKFSLGEPNVLVLDMPEWSEDGVLYNPREEMLRIDLLLRKKYGYPRADGTDVQPWIIGEVKPDREVYLRFKFESSVDTAATLAYEEANAVWLNGERLEVVRDGYFVDRHIYTMQTPGIVRGENELIISAPIGKRTSLENYFILGEFGVKIEGTSASVHELAGALPFGDITRYGMPFYGADITYKLDLTLERDADIRIRAEQYKGALIKVCVDGAERGRIVISPYELEIADLGEGSHTVELVLYTTRVNTFSALHLFGEYWWRGPQMWYTEGEKWAYEYQLFDNGILKSPVVDVIYK